MEGPDLGQSTNFYVVRKERKEEEKSPAPGVNGTSYGRGGSGRPSRSRPKIKIGIFLSRSRFFIEIGEPGPPQLVGIEVKIFEMIRDEPRHVGKS